MTFKVIRGQGQAEEMTSVPYRDYFFKMAGIRDGPISKFKLQKLLFL